MVDAAHANAVCQHHADQNDRNGWDSRPRDFCHRQRGAFGCV